MEAFFNTTVAEGAIRCFTALLQGRFVANNVVSKKIRVFCTSSKNIPWNGLTGLFLLVRQHFREELDANLRHPKILTDNFVIHQIFLDDRKTWLRNSMQCFSAFWAYILIFAPPLDLWLPFHQRQLATVKYLENDRVSHFKVFLAVYV